MLDLCMRVSLTFSTSISHDRCMHANGQTSKRSMIHPRCRPHAGGIGNRSCAHTGKQLWYHFSPLSDWQPHWKLSRITMCQVQGIHLPSLPCLYLMSRGNTPGKLDFSKPCVFVGFAGALCGLQYLLCRSGETYPFLTTTKLLQ